MSPFLLAAIETRADKAVSCHFDIGMRDFVEDAGFLRENRPFLSLKRKRASADLPAPSSSKHFKRDTALQPIQLNSESRFLLLAIVTIVNSHTRHCGFANEFDIQRSTG